MTASEQFVGQIQEMRARLDGLHANLQHDIDNLHAARPVDLTALSERLRNADSLAADVRRLVEETARGAGLQADWLDRSGLDGLIERIRQELIARETEKPRGRLRRLAEELAAGTIAHRSPNRQQQYERLRERARQQVLGIIEGTRLPELPGPEDDRPWLEWAWSLYGPELLSLLDSLRPHLADLAEFIESVEPSQWRPREPVPAPAEVSVTPPQPEAASPAEPLPPPAPDVPVAAEPTPPATLEHSGQNGTAAATEPPNAAPAPVARLDQFPPRSPSRSLPQLGRPAAKPAKLERPARAPQPRPERAKPMLEAAPARNLLRRILASERLSEGPTVWDEPLSELPGELVSFQVFRDTHWITPGGRCETVPWREPAFAERLETCLRAEMEADTPRFHHLWAWVRADELLGREPPISSHDLEVLADLWANPSSPANGIDPGRATVLRQGLDAFAADDVPLDRPQWRVRAFLEAVRPCADEPLGPDEADDLVGQLGFRDDALRLVVHGMLALGSVGHNPIEAVHHALQAAPAADPAKVQAELERKRRDFHEEVKRLWSAAGGNIERTHCREAWGRFVTEIKPTVEVLYPVDRGGRTDWSPADMKSRLGRLAPLHRRIADDYGAKYQDRRRMDRAAQRIVDLASEVNELRRQLDEARTPRPGIAQELVPLAEVRALLEADSLQGEEALCRRLLARLLAPPDSPDSHPLDLTPLDLYRHPDLLGVLEPALLPADGEAPPPRIDAVTDPLRAAAILLAPPEPSPDEDADPLDALVPLLRRHNRFDLLGRLASRLCPAEQARIHGERGDLLTNVQEALADLSTRWHALDELAVPAARLLERVRNEAERLADDWGAGAALRSGCWGVPEGGRAACSRPPDTSYKRPPIVSPLDPMLLRAWVEAVGRHADRVLRAAFSSLRGRALAAPAGPCRDAALLAVEQVRFLDALALLGEVVEHGQAGAQRHSDLPWRETSWRGQSRLLYPDPARTLVSIDSELVAAWRRGITGKTLHADRKLRTLFASFVFGSNQPDDLSSRYGQNNLTDFRLPCQALRACFALHGLNPTFLPQLASFGEVVLLTPPVRLHDASFLQQTANQVAAHDHHLSIVLTPRLASESREAILREFRRRGLAAAVIDDLDLCRLVSPCGRQPNRAIGLFEIAFEQQRWLPRTPFRSDDGRQVLVEMFVGRREQVRKLIEQPTYSRLFSGRKLGKSALLRFIEETEDRKQLPSGQKLRVLYVWALGVESEPEMVERILTAARDRFDFDVSSSSADLSPGDRLAAFLRFFRQRHPSESLLVLLDEADQFVEAQLEACETHGETCLSFRMRSEMEQSRDANGWPLVRFVFAGYRSAQTVGGAWTHWGEVQRLAPLTPTEAADLVGGPLARLGIDAGREAHAIAFRCGYQPAILLRFGACLLERLEKKHLPSLREGIVVTAEDVALTFNDDRVQDAIRTAVRHNFQGNPLGHAIFAALLLEFARRPPGEGLDNAVELVLGRLRKIDPDLSWLCRDGSTEAPEGGRAACSRPTDPSAEVRRQLHVLVDRRLLVERHSGGVSVYALEFPHHLPVLLHTDQEMEVRNARILVLQQAGSEPDRPLSVRGVLSSAALEELRYLSKHAEPPDEWRDVDGLLAGPPPPLSPRAGIVASLWPEAVDHPGAGVADRVGLDPSDVLTAGVSPLSGWSSERLTAPRLAVLDASEADVQTVLHGRPANLPRPLFIGGADLLRWALLRQRQADEVYTVHTPGRLSLSTLRWWFGRVRGLEFDDADAIERIARRTSGIPFLVRTLDRLLLEGHRPPEGIIVTGVQLEQALHDFEAALENDVRTLLLEGPPAFRLTDRERQLLAMVWTVAATTTPGEPVSMRAALTTEWDVLYAEHLNAPAVDEQEDWLALEVVLRLALVPLQAGERGSSGDVLDRLRPPTADDGLRHLVACLGQRADIPSVAARDACSRPRDLPTEAPA